MHTCSRPRPFHRVFRGPSHPHPRVTGQSLRPQRLLPDPFGQLLSIHPCSPTLWRVGWAEAVRGPQMFRTCVESKTGVLAALTAQTRLCSLWEVEARRAALPILLCHHPIEFSKQWNALCLWLGYGVCVVPDGVGGGGTARQPDCCRWNWCLSVWETHSML